MNFAELRKRKPELVDAWDYLERWFVANAARGFVEPYVLSQSLPVSVDHMKLGRALAAMLDAGLLTRLYRAKMAGHQWEKAEDVPEGVVVEFGYSWAASPNPAGRAL